MFNPREFYKAFGEYHGVPDDWTITSLDESCYYREGCPTCGGDYEYSVTIFALDANGKTVWMDVDGKIGEFLSSL